MPDSQALKEKLNLEPIDPPSRANKSGDSTKAKTKTKTKRPTDLNISQIRNALSAQIELLGTLVSGLDSYDGTVIVDKADDLADALLELAKVNKGVRNFLERLIATGAWSGVATVLVGEIVIPIAVHHQKFPEPINSIMAQAKNIPIKEPKNGSKETNTSGTSDITEANYPTEA